MENKIANNVNESTIEALFNKDVDEAEIIDITALSATALLISFGKVINIATNEKVMALYKLLHKLQLPWIIDLVPSYLDLGVFYNLPFIKLNEKPEGLVYDWVKNKITNYLFQIKPIEKDDNKTIEIPICFDAFLPNDLQIISDKTNLPTDEIIELFLDKTYHVFMLGFLPGFAYMGEVDSRIAMPRKSIAVPINAGAVGITGMQAGIYPLASPSGWYIVGHTPFNMFDVKNTTPNVLNAGDKVSFMRITKDMYYYIKNKQES